MVEARAALRVVPLEDGWAQAGTVAAEVNNVLERYIAGRAGKRTVPRDRLRLPKDYLPTRRRRRAGVADTLVDEASIAAHQAAIGSRYGS